MFKDDNLSLYGYALLLTGAILGASLYMEPPRVEVASLELDGIDRIDEQLRTGDISTASIPTEERPAPQTANNWNYPTILWRTYRDGLEEMERTGKPGLLVIQEANCLLCRSYQRLFHDETVTRWSGDYIFILADAGSEPAVQQLYNLDGDYLPRTFVLSPDGGLRRRATSSHPRQKFFVDPHRPDALARLLQAAR